jgi:FimV-like protein
LKRLILFFTGVLLFPSNLHFPQSLIVSSGRATGELIAAGDALVKEFSNEKALQKYLEALAVEPNNAEILWRISRAYVDIGEHLPTATEAQKQAQLQHYEQAAEYARQAIRANPQHSMAYTRRAIAYGRIALFRGVWESLDLVKQVKADLEKALELDPANDVAHYVLARTHARVSERPRVFRWPLGLGWANLNEAIRHYETAIRLKPDFIMYRLDCARAYLEADTPDKARMHLAQIAALPTLDEDDDQFRMEAKALLEKLKKD